MLKTDKLREILRLEEDQIKKIKNTYTYDYFTEKDKYNKFYNVVSENRKRFFKFCDYVWKLHQELINQRLDSL